MAATRSVSSAAFVAACAAALFASLASWPIWLGWLEGCALIRDPQEGCVIVGRTQDVVFSYGPYLLIALAGASGAIVVLRFAILRSAVALILAVCVFCLVMLALSPKARPTVLDIGASLVGGTLVLAIYHLHRASRLPPNTSLERTRER